MASPEPQGAASGDWDYMRPEAEVRAKLNELDPEDYVRRHGPHGQAVVASLRWVLGEVAESPLSGRLGRPGSAEVRAEYGLADQAIYGPPEPWMTDPAFSLPYFMGVENSLAWVRGSDSL